ncbi:uncharacterized protein BKA78DRAFT_295002 [Phyllosticta capitalensis]|uniref:uncharacterized protein n=1 Tax=Phyllosticta capitalensis TaxID=121624 RepID=UPI003131016B
MAPRDLSNSLNPTPSKSLNSISASNLPQAIPPTMAPQASRSSSKQPQSLLNQQIPTSQQSNQDNQDPNAVAQQPIAATGANRMHNDFTAAMQRVEGLKRSPYYSDFLGHDEMQALQTTIEEKLKTRHDKSLKSVKDNFTEEQSILVQQNARLQKSQQDLWEHKNKELEQKNQTLNTKSQENEKEAQKLREERAALDKEKADFATEYAQHKKRLEDQYNEKLREDTKIARDTIAWFLEDAMRTRIRIEMEATYGDRIRGLENQLQSAKTLEDVTTQIKSAMNSVQAQSTRTVEDMTAQINSALNSMQAQSANATKDVTTEINSAINSIQELVTEAGNDSESWTDALASALNQIIGDLFTKADRDRKSSIDSFVQRTKHLVGNVLVTHKQSNDDNSERTNGHLDSHANAAQDESAGPLQDQPRAHRVQSSPREETRWPMHPFSEQQYQHQTRPGIPDGSAWSSQDQGSQGNRTASFKSPESMVRRPQRNRQDAPMASVYNNLPKDYTLNATTPAQPQHSPASSNSNPFNVPKPTAANTPTQDQQLDSFSSPRNQSPATNGHATSLIQQILGKRARTESEASNLFTPTSSDRASTNQTANPQRKRIKNTSLRLSLKNGTEILEEDEFGQHNQTLLNKAAAQLNTVFKAGKKTSEKRRYRSWISTQSQQCLQTYVFGKTATAYNGWEADELRQTQCRDCKRNDKVCIILRNVNGEPEALVLPPE